MKADWRPLTAAGILLLLLIALWKITIGQDAATPTVPVPAGANPQTATPPELPGTSHTVAPTNLAR